MKRKCTCGSTQFTPTDQHDGVPKELRGKENEPVEKHRWFTCDACGAGYRENLPEEERIALYSGEGGA